MNKTDRYLNDSGRSCERGFTLTEMLVAVALLMVIMVIFAQIFSLAVTAMSRQKGMANNDQRARTAFTILDADLKRMSYRAIDPSYRPIRPNLAQDVLDAGGSAGADGTLDYLQHPMTINGVTFESQTGIVPIVPGTHFNGRPTPDEHQGFIYYSENDPGDPTDDVLHFTIDTGIVERPGAHPGIRRYAGQRTELLYGRGTNFSEGSPPLINSTATLPARDQPDWDDGQPGDNVTTSTKAEVVYFLRHGNLYRRVLLLREDAGTIPANVLEFDGSDPSLLAQPAGVALDVQAYPYDLLRLYGGNFYSDYDYSAHHGASPYDAVIFSINPAIPTFGGTLAVLHGSLSNDHTVNGSPLGLPTNRFGFSPTNGRAREFITDGTNTVFIGRYTHEETSNAGFQYPQSTASNVFGRTDFDLTSFQNTGTANVFAGGSRRGADLLLTNVHAFDVEIWDPSINPTSLTTNLGGFVNIDLTAARDLGSRNGTDQHIHENSNWGPINGPSQINLNVFDTWHANPLDPTDTTRPFNRGVLGDDLPPNAPIYIHAPTFGGIPVPSTANGYPIDVPFVPRFPPSGTAPGDAIAAPLSDGMLVLPSSPRDASIAAMGDYVIWEAVYDPAKTILPALETLGGDGYDHDGNTMTPNQIGQPDWNSSPADLVDNTLIPDPNDYDGILGNEPDIRWRAHDNRKPIRALRITILFKDPTSHQLRQMTLVHAFHEFGL